MTQDLPSADEYAAETVRFSPLAVVDLQALQRTVDIARRAAAHLRKRRLRDSHSASLEDRSMAARREVAK